MFRWTRPTVALAGLSMCACMAGAQTPLDAAKKAMQAATDAVKEAGTQRAQLEIDLKSAQQASLAADQQLAVADIEDVKQLGLRRSAALEARKTLRLTTDAKAAAETALDKASDTLYRVTENYIACKTTPDSCGGKDGPVLTDSDVKRIAAVGVRVKEAESTAETIAVAAADAVKLAAVAETNVRDGVADRFKSGAAPVAVESVKHARDATTESKQLLTTLKAVQARMERINAKVVTWAACKPGQACADFSATALSELKTQVDGLDVELALIKDGIKDAKTDAYWLDKRVTTAHADDQKSRVELLVLIDEVPDAKSLFGASDAVRVSASASGAEASIRLDLNRLPNTLTRDTRVIFTAPKGKDGRGRLLGVTDADNVLPSVQLIRDLARDKLEFSASNQLLYVVGVNGKVSYSEHAYRDRAQLDVKKTERNTPLSLGVHLGVAGVDAKKFHLLRANYAEFYKNATVETVCPATPTAGQTWLTCVDASFAEPERQRGWVFGYETRWTWKNAALAFGFEYDRRTNRKTYSLPIYLLRDTDAKDKPFTGGISLDYKTRSTLQPKHSFEFGVFVGAPFSLFTR